MILTIIKFWRTSPLIFQLAVGFKKTLLRLAFSTFFSVFRYHIKHSSSCLIYHLELSGKLSFDFCFERTKPQKPNSTVQSITVHLAGIDIIHL